MLRYKLIRQFKIDLTLAVAGVKYNNVNVNVFPNPSDGLFTIEIPANELAKLLMNITSENSRSRERTTVDLRSFDKGIYFMQIYSNGKGVAGKKLVKQVSVLLGV